MKEYPKTYEDVFFGERTKRKCKLDKVDFDKEYLNVNLYVDTFKDLIDETLTKFWEYIVKFTWLSGRFVYNGYKRKRVGRNNFALDAAYSVFVRMQTGRDYRFFGKIGYITKIAGYFKDFFPEFDKKNPFTEPEYYKLPYNNIGIDFMFLVHQLPERLELLELADKRKMKYDEFLDYVINHTYCQNDEAGETIYELIVARVCPQYIRNNKIKYEEKRRKRKYRRTKKT